MKKSLAIILSVTSILLMTACGAKDVSEGAINAEMQYSEEQPADDTPANDIPSETVENSQPEAVDTEYQSLLEELRNCRVIFMEKATFGAEDTKLSMDADVYSYVIDFENPSAFFDNKGIMDGLELTGKEDSIETECNMYKIGKGEDAFYWGYLYLPQGTEPGDNIELVYYNFVKDEKIRKNIEVSLGEYDFGTKNSENILICENGKYFVCSPKSGITTGAPSGEYGERRYTAVGYNVICLNDIHYKLENTKDFVIRYEDGLDEEVLGRAYSKVEKISNSSFNIWSVEIECGAECSQSEMDADETMKAFLLDTSREIWDNVIIEFKGVQVN